MQLRAHNQRPQNILEILKFITKTRSISLYIFFYWSLFCSIFKRSLALQRADVIVLLGARLNWMLHFGLPPRFAKDVAFIQVDISAEELTRGLALQGKSHNAL